MRIRHARHSDQTMLASDPITTLHCWAPWTMPYTIVDSLRTILPLFLYFFSLLFSPFPIYGGWINVIIIIIIIDNNWYPSVIQFGCSRFCDSINGLYKIKRDDYIMICLCADLLSRPELILLIRSAATRNHPLAVTLEVSPNRRRQKYTTNLA
jgi:hypothetical protein